MRLLGVVCVVGGWVVTVGGLFLSTSNAVRGGMAVAGIGITLYGILGVLNRYYLQRAIWKK